ncbi:reverse transcriptase domain-containing protein [Tanacetum coccineum]
MPPRMTTRSTGRPAAASRGGGTGGRAGDQGRGQGNGRNQNGDAINDNIRGDVRNVIENNNRMSCTYKEFLACNPKEYDGKGGAIVYTRWVEKMESVQDMSGCKDNQKVKYTAGSFVGKALTWWNSQIHTRGREAVGGMIERYVYGLAPKIRGIVVATEPTTIQKAVQIVGTLTDEAIRNGSIKKNPEKRGNGGLSSKDRNGRDDNKRTRTGNAFATTTNPIRRENTSTTPKCTTCNFYHPPEAPCHTCFNCNRPGHLTKDCRVVPRNVNLVNARNLAAAHGACFECGGIEPSDLGFSYVIEIASGQLVEIDKVIKGCKLEMDGHVFDINLISFKSRSFDVIIGERPEEKARHLMSAKAKEHKQEEMVVVRDFPKVRIYQKSQENCQKNGQARTRESEEYKRSQRFKAEARKVKP